MSNHVIAKRRDALELLERLLNTTSLTTKRVSHHNVIGKTSLGLSPTNNRTILERDMDFTL